MPTVDLTAMTFWTPGQLAHLTDADWLRRPADPDQPLSGVSTDSRTVTPHQVFIALHGEKFDGHDYVKQAIANGAAALIIDRDVTDKLPTDVDAAVLRVADTLAALQQIARAYRGLLAQHNVKVVAVVGSNGKTTTRHLIHCLLHGRVVSTASPDAAVTDQPGIERPDTWTMKQLRGSQSPKSFNNHIGVPLTLLGADVDDDFVVVEIGTNHPGEVADLAALACPDAAVVTSIAPEHMAFFKTLEAVAREQASIAPFIRPGGALFVERQALDHIDEYLDDDPSRTVTTYGEDDADLALADFQTTPEGITFGVQIRDQRSEIRDLSVPLLARHNAVNTLAAIAVARWMGVDANQIRLGMLAITGVEGRLQPVACGGNVHIIHDAYNANPRSVTAAIDVLADTPGQRRVAILGDMFELGDAAPDAHRRVGEQLAERDGIAAAILIGPLSMRAADALTHHWPAERIHRFDAWSDELPQRIADLLQPGDTVLLKASRGMALERLLPAIQHRFPMSH